MKCLARDILFKHLPGVKMCMADWRNITHAHFEEFEPLLTICTGEITTSYPLPHIPEFRLEVGQRGDRFIAYTVGDWDQVSGDLFLTLDDVQLWRLDPERLETYLATSGTPPKECGTAMARIIGGYSAIILPSGRKMSLAKKHKRRAFLRAVIDWCRSNNSMTFYAQDIIEDYNNTLPLSQKKSKSINSDRIIDDLFKGQKEEFLELFEVLDLAAAQFRLKVQFKHPQT